MAGTSAKRVAKPMKGQAKPTGKVDLGGDDGMANRSSHLLTELDVKRVRFLEETEREVKSFDLKGEPYPRELLSAFAGTVLRKVEDRYIRHHSGRHVAEQLRDSLRFIGEFREDEIKVRVFSPTLAERGYEKNGSVVETLMRDQPFIFDTIQLFLAQAGVRVKNAMNVVLSVERDGNGKLLSVAPSVSKGQLESYCRLFVEPIENPEDLKLYQAEISGRLSRSQEMVADFRKMEKVAYDLRTEYFYLRNTLKDLGPYLEEAMDFLDWLVEGNFIFMGMSVFEGVGQRQVDVAAGRGLGIMGQNPDPCGDGMGDAREHFELKRPADKYFVQVRKSYEDSVIHRTGKIDEVLVRRFDMEGNPIGGVVFHGLFTYQAISSNGGQIPILQKKVKEIVAFEEATEDTYEYKAIEDAFNSLPVEYLFTATGPDITKLIRTMLMAEREGRTSFHLAIDGAKRMAYLFVVVPKGIYSDGLRSRIELVVQEKLEANYCDHRAFMGKSDSVILHFFLTGDEFKKISEENLLDEIVDICSPWTERLREQLESSFGHEEAAELFHRYGDGFPDAYVATKSPATALKDIVHCERVRASGKMGFDLSLSEGKGGQAVYLSIYEPSNIYLTDILPILDNLGLRVIDQDAFTLKTPKTDGIVIDSFRLDVEGLTRVDILKDRERIEDALSAIFEHKMANDGLNRLLTSTGLQWAEIDILRAYIGYSRQLHALYTVDVVQRVLINNPDVIELLALFFRTKFDPALGKTAASFKTRTKRLQDVRSRYNSALRKISSFVQDHVLRTVFNLMDATLRTNFYRNDRPFHYLSVKLDCAMVEAMVDPRPWREVYVHHIDMEGVHMRGGPVARGGIRWSDRLEDYRSEILGLVTTQMVKNTVIVPVGAKGGFVLKRRPDEDGEVRAFADEMYKVLIRGLLDLTDNRKGKKIVPPLDVVRYDPDDPYLVVAADKGTAHLSDTANALSEEFGFWLGDAFASGGSDGYDHKVEGITAKGAWACTKRHFLEMGLDPEKDVIRVLGIGDMGGDVFGNGMLLSNSIQLVAAFNHLHIFLDPSPDPTRSFKERKRLFEKKGSRWSDYSEKLISRGGGVFDRQSKLITLSAEVQGMLGTAETQMSGEELMFALLGMKIDLLWNGGIGTYIKSSWEDHRDAADKGNDRLRRDAPKVRARVIGEGGNLGVTQKGRIEYALLGGRINTDAVDNAGGVNLSDREVNLKVLFAPVLKRGDIDLEERNLLLRQICQEVVDKVVEDNEGQALRLSLDEIRSTDDIFTFGRCIKSLKKAGIMNPAQESLPTTKILMARATQGQGFVRPELATVGSYVKMGVYQELVASPRIDEVFAERFLRDYFPEAVTERFWDDIESHLLLHEIVCTIQTNVIVDSAGVSLFSELAEQTDAGVHDIARAYLFANEILDAWTLREKILQQEGKASTDGVYRALLVLEQCLRQTVLWLLDPRDGCTVSDLSSADFKKLGELATALRDDFSKKQSTRFSRRVASEVRDLVGMGLSKKSAETLIRTRYLALALPVANRAKDLPAAKNAIRVYFSLGIRFGFLELGERLFIHSSVDPWETVAVSGLGQEFREYHDALTHGVVNWSVRKTGLKSVVSTFLDTHSEFAELARLVKEAGENEPDVPRLWVLGNRLVRAFRVQKITV